LRTISPGKSNFSDSRASRKEMCRLAGRHFFHFIAGSRPVNTPVPDGHFERIRLFEKRFPSRMHVRQTQICRKWRF
jgi:hypothetical protein